MFHTSIRENLSANLHLINWALFAAIVMAVVMFKSSGALATAYGIAVRQIRPLPPS
jgi:KUP system potassium uptake protein